MKKFVRELQDTPAGRRYRRAWREMTDLGRHLKYWKGGTDAERAEVQRIYIKCCEEASTALDVLNRIYAWPEVYPAAVVNYQPPSRGSRRSPTKP